MKIKNFLFLMVLFCISGWGPFDFLTSKEVPIPLDSEQWISTEIKKINAEANNIDQDVLKTSLVAYIHAKHRGYSAKNLTIIDYSKPSTERRLWVVDVARAKVLFNTWVTHGKNSGDIKATSFSNEPGSLKSSLGVFLTTGQPYIGSNGYSLRLKGLEAGFNDKAFMRDIVIHGAWYAHPKVIKKYGLLGRSWGCPAVSEDLVRPLINTIKDKTLIVMYYPDRKWLHNSTFLSG